jgi:hypothetical protein
MAQRRSPEIFREIMRSAYIREFSTIEVMKSADISASDMVILVDVNTIDMVSSDIVKMQGD